jgi:pyruvate,water dikinase
MNFSQEQVVWDREDDAKMTWSKSSDLVLPLQQSLSLYYYQGWAKSFRAVQVVGALRARFVNGYEYRCWQWKPLLDWPETEALQRSLEQHVPRRWHTEWLPAIQRDLEAWSATDIAALADDALAVFLHEMLSRQLYHWEIHAYMGSIPQGAVQRLIDWYLERFPTAPESEPYKLVQGQLNTSTQANHSLWELSRLLTPGMIAGLRDANWSQLPDAFHARFEAHLLRYGLQSNEQRRQAATLLLQYAENGVADPLAGLEQLAAERTEFSAETRSKLAAQDAPIFDALHAVALQNNPLTEDHNLWLDQLSNAATRHVTAEFARRLAASGSLEREQDVEYLTVYELLQWGFGLANPLRPLIASRQAEYEAYRRWAPPAFLGKAPEPATWVDRFSGPSVPLASSPGTLQGVGASAGVVRGRARIAHSLEEALSILPGEILVCPATDPLWTPLFGVVAALVTERGGSLCHAAVVAREYQLPAVVGAHGATEQIRTGQVIEVDGGQGIVTVLG